MPESSSSIPASETPTPTPKKSQKVTVPLSERAAYSVVEAGAMLGFGPSKSYEMAACGAIPTITIVTDGKKGKRETRRVLAEQFRRKFGLGEPEAK
jgi:hypothetical protein